MTTATTRQCTASISNGRGFASSRQPTVSKQLEQTTRADTLGVIVTDLTLPRLDGWEVVRRLKGDPKRKHIPVLALTAHALVGDAAKAMEAGCDGYLAKPCLPEDLARAIRSVLKGRCGPSQPTRPPRNRPRPVGGPRARHRVSMLVRLAPGTDYPPHRHDGIEELHLLEGELIVDEQKYYPGDYRRADAGTVDRRVWSETGCPCVLITSFQDAIL